MLGIDLLDHLILAEQGVYSFRPPDEWRDVSLPLTCCDCDTCLLSQFPIPCLPAIQLGAAVRSHWHRPGEEREQDECAEQYSCREGGAVGFSGHP